MLGVLFKILPFVIILFTTRNNDNKKIEREKDFTLTYNYMELNNTLFVFE